jgi:hypothetical protein
MGKHIIEYEKQESHPAGCVTKHVEPYLEGDPCSYRYNGYQEISSVSWKKEVYEVDFTEPANAKRLPYFYFEYKIGTNPKWADKQKTEAFEPNWRWSKNPVESKTAWTFSEDDNYKTAYVPYVHNFHHIMPDIALRKALAPDELLLLQQAKYNINGKKNLIILPSLEAYAYALKLPSHYSNHIPYNDRITEELDSFRSKVEKNSEVDKNGKHKLSDENKEDYAKAIVNWQNREYKLILKYGKELADTTDPGKHFDDSGRDIRPERRNTINEQPVGKFYTRKKTT